MMKYDNVFVEQEINEVLCFDERGRGEFSRGMEREEGKETDSDGLPGRWLSAWIGVDGCCSFSV